MENKRRMGNGLWQLPEAVSLDVRFGSILAQGAGELVVGLLPKGSVLAGQEGVEEDAHDGGHGQAGEGDVQIAHGEADGAGDAADGIGTQGGAEVDANGQTDDQSGHDDVAGLLKVGLSWQHLWLSC